MNTIIKFVCDFININIVATWVIIAVLFLRFILGKAPKWFRMVLWSFVGIRLAVPFSIKSKLSLIPTSHLLSTTNDYTTPYIESGLHVFDNAVNHFTSGSYSPMQNATTNTFGNVSLIFASIWIIGFIAMVFFWFFSYYRLKKRIGTAVFYKNNIYQSEKVKSPFVLGIIKPKIYLPFNISDQETEYVIAHENAHIKYKDNLIKLLSYILLSVYWFNPIVWLAYVVLCKDMELLCDERVTKNYSKADKANYSETLLALSSPSNVIKICPISFGEINVKGRIKSILNYKKPALGEAT